MHKIASVLASGLFLCASNALADDAPHVVVTARVLSYERPELLTQKVCALVAIAEVGGHARLFDITVDGKRCSPLAPEGDAVSLRVRIEPEQSGFRNVIFEADVTDQATAREMNASVDGAARELYEHLGGGAPLPKREPRRVEPPPPKPVETKPQQVGGYVAPTIVPYEGGAIPSDAKIITQPNLPVLGTGVGLFVASYGGALIYALSTCGAQESCRGGSSYLYIPFIGPLITAASNETPTTGGRAVAAFDGGVQIVGGALAIASFVWPKKFVLWQSKTASVQVTPTTMGAGTSAGVAVTVTNF